MECYFFNNHFDNNSSEALLPPGFRFHPTDEELITYYLVKKVLNNTFNGRAIAEVDLNKCEPWELPANFLMKSELCSFLLNFLFPQSKLESVSMYQSPEDEWVISRVFQQKKTTTTTSSKKKRLIITTTTTATSSANMNLCLELPTSPSSSLYLPPLLQDSSPFKHHPHNYSYYTTTTPTEHVSCFSNNNNFNNGSFDFAPQPLTMDPFALFQRNLKQLPFFFSPAEQNYSGGGSDDFTVGNRPMPAEQRMADGGFDNALGPSELNCMWGY
ncbi:hypothetical protein RIF29_39061 [Crotalaria pallida]|uniref:NAC domain-containing protein n=1 Tax=Crotalaria pallida TaxID=3830 RepID=A0AAN9E2Z1_CROPI